MSEWIKVSEGLPPMMKDCQHSSIEVLVYAPETRQSYEYYGAAWYDHDALCWRDTITDEVVGGVTHWMPLPEPPEDNRQ